MPNQTIQEFKEGKHNILVSTSIGEEGLDIGEVDFVVIYDMPKQSIKLVGRMPRIAENTTYTLSFNVSVVQVESVTVKSTS
jgi:ERCC4-related helicase